MAVPVAGGGTLVGWAVMIALIILALYLYHTYVKPKVT